MCAEYKRRVGEENANRNTYLNLLKHTITQKTIVCFQLLHIPAILLYALPVYVREHSRVHDSRSHHCYASAQPVHLRKMYQKQLSLAIHKIAI
jgi:hypothetical protein